MRLLRITSLIFVSLIFLLFLGLLINKFFRKKLDTWFINYGKWTFYNTILLISFIFCLLIPNFFPKIGRSLDYLILLVLIGFYGYFGLWNLKFIDKIHISKLKIYHIFITMIFFTSIGAFVSTLIQKGPDFKHLPGLYIGLILNVLGQALFWFGWAMFNPRVWEIGLMILSGIILSVYINLDLKFMMTKRGEEYLTDDWLLGVVHLHTDIFYRFWRDLF